ncbi:MAG: hypothetical protein K8S55_13445 [Phycisphaerae bacterium]|nr:hypothetical protein [Phycisphaerae bacterium]
MRNTGLIVVILLAVLSAGFLPGLAMAADTPKPAAAVAKTPAAKLDITISKETTYILGPINEDGTVNYLAYFNNKYSKGVTKDNNAFVLLLKAFGPSMIDEKVRGKVLKKLGIESLPAKGEYFIRWYDYVPTIEPKENAGIPVDYYKQFGKAGSGPWLAKDYPIIADWLKKNEKPLALLQKAAQRPRYFAPLMSPFAPEALVLEAFFFRFTMQCRYFAKAMACRAMLKYGSGDVTGAWADLAAVRKMGRHLYQGPFLIDYLIGRSVNETACDGMAKIAVSGKLTAKQAKRFLAENNTLPQPDIFPAITNERLFALDMILFIARGGSPDVFYLLDSPEEIAKKATLRPESKAAPLNMIDWDEILRTANCLYDRQMKIFRIANTSERKQAHEKFVKEMRKLSPDSEDTANHAPTDILGPQKKKSDRLKALIDKARKSKPRERKQITQEMTKILLAGAFDETYASYSRVITFHESGIMRDELVGVALALAAYKAEKGAYPQKLAELSPAYLKAIPADRFSGKPLIYKTRGKGYLLYSVGMNLKDDGGKKEGDNGDIIIEAKR